MCAITFAFLQRLLRSLGVGRVGGRHRQRELQLTDVDSLLSSPTSPAMPSAESFIALRLLSYSYTAITLTANNVNCVQGSRKKKKATSTS